MHGQERAYLVPKQLESIDVLEAERTSYYHDGVVKERELRTLTRLNFPNGVRRASNPDPIGAIAGIVVGGILLAAGIAILQDLFGRR